MKLNKAFVLQYAAKTPPWGPVGEITFLRTYSRDGERWFETCERVVNGSYFWQEKHCVENNRPWDDVQAQHSAQQMYDLMYNMKFLPPGRGLRNMGCSILETKGGAAANNCGFVSTEDLANDLSDPFCWAMDMLMLGVGVGFDVLGAGTKLEFPHGGSTGPWVIDDSREGWVTALGMLLGQYKYRTGGNNLEFDYSKIRPEGSPIKGSGGISSGPGPLKEMLNAVREILYKAASSKAAMLTSTHINDIFALIGRCVVSGGVRRSAEIAIGSPDDHKFLQLKNYKRWPKELDNYRYTANHSVNCEVGKTDYHKLYAATEGVDEFGVFWLENAQRFGRMGRRPDNADSKALGCNPCAEQTLEHKELCCLVEVFPSRITSFYEFQKVLKYAYLYAKSVTTIPVHDMVSNAIIARNRRIGCSLTGIQQAINQLGNTEFYSWCDRGYKYLKQLDERYSEWLSIPKSIKITSVKPSGSVSKLPGVNSGIHFPCSHAYWQTIRLNNNHPLLARLTEARYRVVDLHPKTPNTSVVYFGVVETDFTRGEAQVPLWEQAMHAVKLQHHWSDNQVSITLKYDLHEEKQIPFICGMLETSLKSVSFFPVKHHDFEHAPWQEEDIDVIREYNSTLKKVQYDYKENTHDSDDLFCSGSTCELPGAE